MAIRKHANNYSSTLNGAISDVATTLTVTSATGLPSIGAGEEYNLTLDDGAGTIEIVTVTDDASSPSLTVTRGAEGTTPASWADLATIELRPTANGFDRKADGAASSTDNAIARYDGTSGKVLQNSAVTIDDSGNITTSGTVDGRDLSTDGTKLDGIEALADVTDATNVKAALNGMSTSGVTPASGDKILLLDASDSDNLKHALFSAFGGGGAASLFIAQRSTGQTITTSTYTKVQLDTEVVDSDGTYDNATNYRHTPTVAGSYLYITCVSASTLGDQKGLVANLYKNGAQAAVNFINASGATGTLAVATAVFEMNGSTDYVESYIWHNHGSNQTTIAVGAYNYLIGIRIE